MSATDKKTITRLVICVDGTWMGPNGTNERNGTRNNSNVFRVFASCPEVVYDDTINDTTIVQKRKYYHGLGQRLKGASSFYAGAFGEGCEDMIADVYQYCCETTKSSEDELWMYGFSRGAYIVRAVAALFDQIGALNTAMINEPSERTTFDKEYIDLLKLYKEKRDGKEENADDYHFSARSTRDPPKLKFIGLFDTVRYTVENELLSGITPSMLKRWRSLSWLAARHDDSEPDTGLHNLSLLNTFENVRHALAINEDRIPFTPVRFAPTVVEQGSATRTFIEAWFLGTHLDIGGSAQCDGLSIYPLQWILHESAALGLRIGFESKREKTKRMIEDPLSLAFPQGLPGSWSDQRHEELFWTFRYLNDLYCTMQDIRKIHMVGDTGSGRSTNRNDHSIVINYASFWSGGMQYLRKPRGIFDFVSLRGHLVNQPYGTIIHPSVYFLRTYKSIFENDPIIKTLRPCLEIFSNRLRYNMAAEFPWTVTGPEVQLVADPDSSSSVHTYEPVSLTQGRFIRLLNILPALSNEPLRCTFLEISLEDPVEYCTLIWSWSTSAPPCELIIMTPNGEEAKRVSHNLITALLAFRSSTSSQLFWIDQVCINLQDNLEKNSTVAWRPEIFQKATSVSVWPQTSEPGHFYEEAIELLSQNPGPQRLAQATTQHERRQWNNLVTLLHKPVVFRKWIVSEVANNVSVTICCGRFRAPWSALCNAAELLCAAHEYGLLTSSVFTQSNLNLLRTVADLPAVNFIRAVANLQQCFLDRQAEAKARQIMIQELPLHSNSGSFLAADHKRRIAQPFLADLVLSLSTLTTYRPVDCIYAVLSLSFEYPLNIFSEDYKLPLVSVYANFVRYTISAYQSLDIICQPWASNWPTGDPRHKDLPSWIGLVSHAPYPPSSFASDKACRLNPDPLAGKYTFGHESRWRYSASGNTQPVWHLQSDLLLSVAGFVLGAISNIGPPATNGHVPIGEWSSLLGNDRDLWRILIGDRDKSGRIRASGYFQSVFEDIKRTYMEDGHTLHLEHALTMEKSSFSREYLHLAEGIVWDRALVKVEGMCGLAPQHARIGDLVVILKGCSVPVVLRTSIVAQAGVEEGMQYTVIGDCYMDGIMLGGKAIQGRDDIEKFVLN